MLCFNVLCTVFISGSCDDTRISLSSVDRSNQEKIQTEVHSCFSVNSDFWNMSRALSSVMYRGRNWQLPACLEHLVCVKLMSQIRVSMS